jgi:hypothetical protein
VENKREGERQAGSTTRKNGKREGLGRRSWRLTEERGGPGRRDEERRERVRHTAGFTQRMRREESTRTFTIREGVTGSFRKGTRKQGPHMSVLTLRSVVLRPCFTIQRLRLFWPTWIGGEVNQLEYIEILSSQLLRSRY